MRLLPYTSANCVHHAFLLHCVPLVSRDWQQRDSPHTCITLWLLWVEPLPILSYGAFRPDRLQAFRLRYTARLQCHLVGMAESDRHKAHQCTQSLTALLALLLLNDGEQQLARCPLGHRCVHIHIHSLAVTIKQETAVWVLLGLA